ncbi:MAG: putative ABC transporter permease [Firmicutes bacterium]|nr:putative ABC transporter permease [Bacillota bacterium]
MLARLIIYGLLGWIMEIIWTGLGSAIHGNWRLVGKTYLWMFPIYGLAVFLEPIHDRIRPLPAWVRGLIWMAVIFAIEYLAGWVLKLVTGSCPWDYSRTPYSINGFIRLDYAPAWFAVGLLFERVHDEVKRRTSERT